MKNKYYVLFCKTDSTFLNKYCMWTNDIEQAFKFKDLDKAKKEISRYVNSVVVMELHQTLELKELEEY